MSTTLADQVLLTVSPESLYHSATRLTARICLNGAGTYNLSFPESLQLTSVDVTSTVGATSWQVLETENKRMVQLRNTQPGEITVNLLVSEAVQDSGWDLYPLVAGHLKLNLGLDSYRTLRFRVSLPKGCRGYIRHSSVKVHGLSYDFSRKTISAGRGLMHEVSGMRDLEVSFALVHNNISSQPLLLEADIYFRQTFISLSGAFLLPYLIGFPIILVWGFSGIDPGTRLTLTLSAIPVVFSMWYRTLSTGIQDILSLMDGIYIFLALVWTSYAIFFQTQGTSVGLGALVPYFGLIAYAIYILFGFEAHPYKDPIEDPTWRSIPTIFKLYRRIIQNVHKIFDVIYYHRRS
jgi:hypothetical protein